MTLAVAGGLDPPALLATTEYDCSPVTPPRSRQTSVSVAQLVQLYAVGLPLHEDSSTASEPTVGDGFGAVTTRLHTGADSGGGGGGGVLHVTCTFAGRRAPFAFDATTP